MDPPGANPFASTTALILQLVRREEFRYSPTTIRTALEDRTIAPAATVGERSLIAAAASIAAGEPKRALRELSADGFAPGSDGAAVAEALRHVALALDRNWFPGGGGAVLEEGDLDAILGQPLPPAGPAVGLLVEIAANVVAMAGTWRSILDGSRRSGQLVGAASILDHVESVGMQVAAFADPSSMGYLAMIHADLAVRAGQYPAGANLLGVALARYGATNDVAGAGSVSLVRGDWSAAPVSRPETLGLDLESAQPASTVEISPDFPFAKELYDQAAASFTFAGAERGIAAVELRRAYLDSVEGARDAARRRLTAALDRGTNAGDGAFVQLARVHLAILDVGGDVPFEPEAIGREIAAWAVGDGSYSYARGLARLCLAAARRWREQGDFLRGRSVLRISDAINAGVGAVQEPALVNAVVAELYGGANYRRALLVLTELDLDAAITGLRGTSAVLPWLELVDRTTGAQGAAIALRDSDAISRTIKRLRRLRVLVDSLTPDAESAEPMMVATVSGVIDESIAQGEVLVSLYRGTAARSLGVPQEAEQRFAEALGTAMRLEPDGGTTTVAVLATMGRRADAHALIQRLTSLGVLQPDLAAAMFLRVGAGAEAKQELAKVDAMGSPPGRAIPLDEAAMRAEIAAANGEWDAAATIAGGAIAEFEGRLARLSRDVLRISLSDNLDVASLYTTAIRARLALDDPSGAESFCLSDRCRGISLADLLAGDAAAGATPAVVASMRRWLRAGVLLAQAFEEISSQPMGDGAAVRLRIASVEGELDDAEAALDRAGGGVLASRSQAPPTPDLADIQSLLGKDTVLLQYHLFDDELFVWAVTVDRAEVVRRGAPTASLSGDARRFHRLCGDGVSTVDQRAELGAALAERLLGPVASWLADHSRVVVVPHAGLSLLPFHLLPFGGDNLGAGRVVSYLPAASVAPRWRDRPPVRLDQDALVVGDPLYGIGRGLRQLPAARLEAAVVAAALGAEPLVGEDATQEAVLARLPSAHVLHLATHGRALDGAPNSAELALAGEGRLTIADLMGSDTDIDLAVLSACDTGRGSATASGDVVGLTRALLGAGARDIIVSLWPVDDRTACLTMARFYERLQAGDGVASALADAQAEVRRRSPNERESWYERLRAGDRAPEEQMAGGTGGRREWPPVGAAPAAAADPGHPALWGPFVHIGL